MIRQTIRWKHWWLRRWRCCGKLWELLLSPKWPDRADWNPECPVCGSTIDRDTHKGKRSIEQ